MHLTVVKSSARISGNVESLNDVAASNILCVEPVAVSQFPPGNLATGQLSRKPGLLFLVALGLVFGTSAWSASFYTQRLEDKQAVYVAPSGGDDTDDVAESG